MMQRRVFVAGMAAVMAMPSTADGQPAVKPILIGYLSPTTGRLPVDDAFETSL